MRIAYIIFDKITWLDFIGIYDPISRLKSMGFLSDLTWDICAYSDKNMADNFGLKIVPTKVKNALTNYDAIIIPGGLGTRQLQFDNEFINWIKTSQTVKYKI